MTVIENNEHPDLKAILNTVLGVILLESPYHLNEFADICGIYSYQCLQDIEQAKTKLN